MNYIYNYISIINYQIYLMHKQILTLTKVRSKLKMFEELFGFGTSQGKDTVVKVSG